MAKTPAFRQLDRGFPEGGFLPHAHVVRRKARQKPSKLVVDVSRGIISCDQWVAQDVRKVFNFFSDPYNLELLTPSFLNFRITRLSDKNVTEGTEIDYRLSLHGLPLRWRSRILGWRANESFSDLQLIGPYRYWHHRHTFEAADGGTWIRDRVDFSLPFHFLSRRIMGAYVKKDLENIFKYRQTAVIGLLRGDHS